MKELTNEEKKNHQINFDRGMAVRRLKETTDWRYMEDVHRDLLTDLYGGLFIDASPGKPLCLEPTYGQIMAHRQGVMDGVKQFFSLLDKLESVYLNSKGE